MNSLWILLACGVVCAYAHPTCDDSALTKCNAMMPSFDKGDMFPTDRTELQKQCSEVIPGFDCYADLIGVCPALLPEFAKGYIVEANVLLRRVCEEGDYQNKYLENAKCLDDIMTNKVDICYERAAKEYTYLTCSFFKSLERCFRNFVEDTCSSDAVTIFDDLMNVIKPFFENGVCPKH